MWLFRSQMMMTNNPHEGYNIGGQQQSSQAKKHQRYSSATPEDGRSRRPKTKPFYACRLFVDGCVLCQQHAPTKRSACVQYKQPIINFILHILINLLVRIYVRRDRLPYTLKIHSSWCFFVDAGGWGSERWIVHNLIIWKWGKCWHYIFNAQMAHT